MAETPDPIRNRRGCYVILTIVAVAIALYALVGFSAQPGNDVAHKIPTVPRR